MKILLLSLCILFVNESYSQVNFPINEKGKIEYNSVVSVDSANKELLFSRAKLFIAESFKSAKAVIEMEDPSSGSLFLKGNISITVTALGSGFKYGYVRFTMSLQCKDNKYRYSITDFYHDNPSDTKSIGGHLENEKPAAGTFFVSKKYWAEIKEQTDKSVKELIKNLSAIMSSSLKSDW